MSEKESIAVSVIIPVHNAAGYISDTLSTVLSQTLNDIEIIIVNDCSDDNTLEIVSALAETDSRIRVINNTTNLGGGGSRNIGLDAATGEYVIFLDDDDYVDNMMLERMYARAREGANKQVISSQADSLIKISRIWADFFPANTSNQPI